MSDHTDADLTQTALSEPASTPAISQEPVAVAPAPGWVLVVEDEDLLRWSTARTLRRAGYQVLEAGDADEALICMAEHGDGVSLVISDVIMPKQSGYELAHALRRQWSHLRIVLISGYTPVAMERHGIQSSEFELLRKPVVNLAHTVAQLIGPASPS